MFLPNLLKILLLAMTEGITEWLPISSTGHLILLGEILAPDLSPAFLELFDVVVQLGAIGAVILCYFHDLNPLSSVKFPEERRETLRLWGLILLGVIPSAVAGFLWEDLISRYLYRPLTVAAALILFGIAFLLMERLRANRPPRVISCRDMRVKDALGVGLFQVLSLIPGTSRSGATIFGGLTLGLSRPTAARFSFFLAIPTMMGASLFKGLDFLRDGFSLRAEEWFFLLFGSLCALLVSRLTLRFLCDFVNRHGFFVFGVYRILLGLAILIF